MRKADVKQASPPAPPADASAPADVARIRVHRQPQASPTSPEEQALRDLVQLAADVCEADAALLARAQEKGARVALAVGETATTADAAAAASFASAVIEARDLVLVEAAPRARAKRKSEENAAPSCFAGAPAIGPGGEVLGALCVAGAAPRTLTDGQSRALVGLARQVGAPLAAREEAGRARQAYEKLAHLVHDIAGVSWEGDAERTRCVFACATDARLFGHAPEAWRDDPSFWTRILHHADRDWVRARARSEAQAGRDYEIEYRVLAADGRVLWVLDRVRFERDERGAATSARGFILDVTQRKEAERRAEAHHEITRLLAHANSGLEEVAPTLLAIVCEKLGWDRGAMWRPRDDGSLRCVALWRPAAVEADEFDAQTRERVLVPGEGLPGRVLTSRRAEHITTLDEDANFPRLREAARAGLRSAVGFPIQWRDGTMGILEFYSVEPRALDEPALSLFDNIGWQIGEFLERRAAGDAVLASNAHRGAILAAALDCIITIDERGRITEWNPAAERTFGYTRDEAMGQTLGELIVPPELREIHARGIQRAVETREYRRLGERMTLPALRRDGSRFTAEVALAHVPGSDPPHFTGFIRDISEPTRLEEALRASESRYRALVEATAQIVWTAPADGRVADLPQWRDYTGQAAAEVRGWGWLDAVHPDDRQRAANAWRAALENGSVLRAEFRVRRADGTYRTMAARAVPVRDAKGAIREWTGTYTDIEEGRAAQRALEESRHRYEQILDSVQDMVFCQSGDTRVTYVNDAARRYYGASGEQALGVRGPDAEAEAAAQRADDRLVFETGEPTETLEEPRRRHDGSIRLFHTIKTPIFDREGRVVEVVGVSRDVTERRRAAESLRFQAALLEAQMESMPVGLLVMSPGGEVVSYNRRFCDTWDLDESEIQGKGSATLLRLLGARLVRPEGFMARVEELHEQAETVATDELQLADARVLDWYSAPVRGQDGTYYGRIWTFEDVTEQRRTQQKLSNLLVQVEDQRRRLDTLIASVPGVVWESWGDPSADDHRVDFVSEHMRTMLGYTVEECLATPRFWTSIIHPEDRARALKDSAALFHAGAAGHVEFRWLAKDGRVLDVVSNATAIKDDNGKPVGMRGVTLDVSDRRRAMEALKRSDERFQLLAHATNDAVWDWELANDAVWWNDNFYAMFGWNVDEVEPGSESWISRVHPDDLQRVHDNIRAAIDGTASTWTDEYRFRHKDGTYVHVLDRGFIARNRNGRAYRMIGSMMDVTDRKRAESAIREGHDRLDLALQAARLGAWDLDLKTDTAVRSLRHDQIFGYESGTDDWGSTRFLKHVVPEHRAAVQAAFTDAFTSGRLFFECEITRVDGSSAWITAHGTVVYTDGEPARMLGVVADISDRKQNEQAVRTESERNRIILESISDAFFAMDKDWRVTYVNARAEAVLSRSADELLGRSLWELYPEIRGTSFETMYLEALRTHTMQQTVEYFPPHDRWYEVRAYPSADGLSVYFQDVTERKRADDALREHSQLLLWQRAVLESIAHGEPLEQTLDLLCRQAEESFPEHHFSVLLADRESQRLRHGAAPSLPPHYTKAIDGILIADGVGSCGTAAYRREPVHVNDIENDPLWAEFKGLALPIGLRACWSTPILGSDGRLLGTWAVYRGAPGAPEPKDEQLIAVATRLAAVAMERAAAEDELRYQRDLVKTIADNTGSALFMMDDRGYPVFMNHAARIMTGYASLDEIQSRPLHDAVHFRKPDGSDYPMEECPIDRANAEIVPLKDQREIFCRRDGELFPVEYNVAPVVRDGKKLGAVLEVRDITEQLSAENDLRTRAEELARLTEALQKSNQELDQFAYVTSHDLKAPLRGIANLATWIEEDLGAAVDAEAKQHLDLLRGRVHRMEALIDAILHYSRVGRIRVKPEPVRVTDLLRETVDLLSPPPGFAVDVHGEMPELVTEKSRLQQVFMNLIGNAIKHHHDPSRGRVDIRCEDAGDAWRFDVSDNGPGIAPRFHEKIFVIFQTLEARDKVEGTGVGLALVKKIVQTQGGTIEVESDDTRAPGSGATFRFTWPKKPSEPDGDES